MTRFRIRKKFDFRKFINRTKNRFQRVWKFCRMHTLPVLVAVGIMVSVIFASYQNAYATGLEEYFYYTYFDLMSGLFAETGMQFGLKDDYYTRSDRVSGKQVWDNFCTWVEQKAKVAALPVEVVNKTVFDELKNLPNTVTSAGAKMSEKLSELLAKVLPKFQTDNSISESPGVQIASYEQQRSLIASVCGTSVDAVPNYTFPVGNYLQIVSNSSGDILIFDSCDPLICLNDGYYTTTAGGCGCPSGIMFSAGSYTAGYRIYPLKSYSFIVKNGLLVSADGTTINDYANVKKAKENTVYVPGVGWKTEWEIWNDILDDQGATDKEKEEWWLRYHVNELLKDLPDSGGVDPDDEKRRKKDNEKDKLPVAIPIILPNKKPDSTEKDSEKDSEKGTEDVAPGGKPKPGSSEKPGSTQKDTEKDSESDSEKATDPGDLPPIADRAGNWKRLFPFCIPWDMMSLIKSMKADKKAPVFEFKYTFKAVNYTWVIKVDMSDYWKYIKIFRWGMTIFFIIGLFFLTVKFTTFVYKMGS